MLAIVLPIRSFVLPRPHCRCRLGLLKVPIIRTSWSKLTQTPTQMSKPTYEVRYIVTKIDAIPKTNIKAPNTICAMANPRKVAALYTMAVIKLATNRRLDQTPRKSKLQNLFPGNPKAFDCFQFPVVRNVTLPWPGWGI